MIVDVETPFEQRTYDSITDEIKFPFDFQGYSVDYFRDREEANNLGKGQLFFSETELKYLSAFKILSLLRKEELFYLFHGFDIGRNRVAQVISGLNKKLLNLSLGDGNGLIKNWTDVYYIGDPWEARKEARVKRWGLTFNLVSGLLGIGENRILSYVSFRPIEYKILSQLFLFGEVLEGRFNMAENSFNYRIGGLNTKIEDYAKVVRYGKKYVLERV